ncbi:hypothetical protein ONS95_001466 [Cadophora gregata]|uniref:uncharacterized protein n=1 Tax=Cadophora gregata TaxID=51156 RepID=UPI0026DAE7FC|nr:uncharacterized protein ONS95_001466 [Cadophora gregata]KAK0111088.1 hypothetical protein ONS95_001466 [Cadophora gregata]KAK0112449.1 hypothetical protein ONS96_001688 [Cadophora gregata f. sp. sojae]
MDDFDDSESMAFGDLDAAEFSSAMEESDVVEHVPDPHTDDPAPTPAPSPKFKSRQNIT